VIVMRQITAPLGATFAAVALSLSVGCGGPAEVEDLGPTDGRGGAADAGDTNAGDDPSDTGVARADVTADAGAGASTPAPATSQVARTDQELTVYGAAGGAPVTVLTPTTGFGSPRALMVVAEEGDWLEVALPVRPNGSTGWIRRGDVELRSVDEAIVVDLTARTLTLYDAGAEVLTAPVAIGAGGTPTPVGRFYVVDKLDTGDPTSAYGQFALGLSAFAVLTEFAGGDGQVGIHGTNDPASIGRAVSHGCIRVPNEVAAQLSATINLGTPVTVAP
jgi:L,D-transpeptidase catalytic domain